jgi:molybdate transport system ATP-binding protein
VVRQGTAAEVLGDPAFRPGSVRGVGAVLKARVLAHHDDGLSELDASGARLLLPRVPQERGQGLRVRIMGQDVTIALDRPENISALNVLPAVVEEVSPGTGPGAVVALRTQAGRVLARVTKRSAAALNLVPGLSCYAIIKTVAIAPQDVGS